VRGENTLAIIIIEPEPDIEAAGWFRKIEINFDLES
jgi:hypothetical protein